MQVQIRKGKIVSVKGRGVLLKKIITKSLPIEVKGGAIIANRIVGITSNAVLAPPSNTMASIGMGLNFSKHIKTNSQSIQKKKDRDENIKFVF